jgi:hypothetical protein
MVFAGPPAATTRFVKARYAPAPKPLPPTAEQMATARAHVAQLPIFRAEPVASSLPYRRGWPGGDPTLGPRRWP